MTAPLQATVTHLRTWAPLLAGQEARLAESAVRHVAEDLLRPDCLAEVEPDLVPSLTRGLTGVALFYGHLALAWPGEGWEERSLALAGQAMEAIGEDKMTVGLYSGFPGLAWTLDHLQGQLLGGGEDLNESIDAYLLEYFEVGPRPMTFDLTGGMAGQIVYAAGRLHRPAGPALLARAVRCLEEAAEPAAEGCTWLCHPEFIPSWRRADDPRGYYDLGPAHGVPGVIGALGLACAADVEGVRAYGLLERAVSWLLARRNPEGAPSRFHRTLPLDRGPEPTNSRVGWCYGDLGTAVALVGAGRRTGRRDWEEEGLALARVAAGRPVEGANVRDPSLCHGSAGAAHLFHSLHQATGEACFGAAARRWYAETLAFWQPGRGIGGFLYWVPPAAEGWDPTWEVRPSFLEGSAGIALGLLAGISPVVPAWDRLLLMDLPTSLPG